jgi:hypothetical protein
MSGRRRISSQAWPTVALAGHSCVMGEVLPLPARGEVFSDPRGEGRTLRVSWHDDEHMLVLSMWQLGQCRATFRLPSAEVPGLVHALVSGLSDGLAAARDTSTPVEPTPIGRSTGADDPTEPAAPDPAAAETVAIAAEPPAIGPDADTTVVDPETAAEKPSGPAAAPLAGSGPVTGEKRIPGKPGAADVTGAPPAVFLAPPSGA